MKKIIATFFAVAMLATTPAPAQDFEKGEDAFFRGDYETALKEWKPLAEKGHADAQYNLGRLYRSGSRAQRDYAEAVKWYRLAAEQGHEGAQYYLGYMYRWGEGVEADYFKAAEWYGKAAEQGHLDAQMKLAAMYKTDLDGFPKNYVKAEKWYRMAAAQGKQDDPNSELTRQHAQILLGKMYESGQGVLQDYTETAKWYRKAAEQGNVEAQNELGLLFFDGKGVAQDNVAAHVWFNIAARKSGRPFSPFGASDAAWNRDKLAEKLSPADINKAQALARKCLESNYRDCP